MLTVFTVKLGRMFKQHYVSKSLPETWCFHIISEIFARYCQDTVGEFFLLEEYILTEAELTNKDSR